MGRVISCMKNATAVTRPLKIALKTHFRYNLISKYVTKFVCCYQPQTINHQLTYDTSPSSYRKKY